MLVVNYNSISWLPYSHPSRYQILNASGDGVYNLDRRFGGPPKGNAPTLGGCSAYARVIMEDNIVGTLITCAI